MIFFGIFSFLAKTVFINKIYQKKQKIIKIKLVYLIILFLPFFLKYLVFKIFFLVKIKI